MRIFFIHSAIDYTLENVILEMTAGAVSRQCAFISVQEDEEIEAVEMFTVSATLISSTISRNLITVSATEALIVINDNDNNVTSEYSR